MKPRPFLILRSQRARTVYLQELISSHPDAHCYGEVLLGMDGPAAVGFPGPLARQRLLRHAWQHVLSGSALRPQRVLRRAVDSPETGVAGVRVMYNQVNRRVMRFMEDPSVSVIHVRRANILQQYVSLTQMRERQRTLGASSAHSRAPVTFAPTIVKPQLARRGLLRGATLAPACRSGTSRTSWASLRSELRPTSLTNPLTGASRTFSAWTGES